MNVTDLVAKGNTLLFSQEQHLTPPPPNQRYRGEAATRVRM